MTVSGNSAEQRMKNLLGILVERAGGEIIIENAMEGLQTLRLLNMQLDQANNRIILSTKTVTFTKEL